MANISCILIFLCALGTNTCRADKICNERSNFNLSFSKTITTDSINRIQGVLKNGDKLDICYKDSSIKININGKVIAQIPYSIPDEIVIPCNGLAVKCKNKPVIYKDYYINKDNFLLLPVFDFDGRINLFGINIKNGEILQLNKPRKSKTLSTNLTWFILDEDKGVIRTFDSLDDEGKSLMHIFKISPSEFLHIKSTYKKIGFDVFSDELKVKKYIEKMLKW